MADLLTMPPVVIDPVAEADEQKRQRPTQMPAAIIPPATPRDRELMINATTQPIRPPARPVDTTPPNLGSTMPSMAASTSANAVRPAQSMPPVPVGPQTQRYEDLAQKGAPQLSGWRKALDTIGSIFPIGRAVESAIPGTPQNYDAKLTQAAMRAAKEQGIESSQQALQTAPFKADLERRNIESEITARNEKDSAALARQGLMRDKDGQIIADENSPVFQTQQRKLQDAETAQKNLQTYRQSQIDLNEAREEVERAKNDPNSPAYKQAEQKLAMAAQAHAIAAQNLGLHQAELANKLQEQELIKPSGQAQSRGSAAQAALDILPDLQNEIKKNAKELGPIFGRLARGEIAIGNVDKNIARLYSGLTSFYALNPAVHGFRNFEFVKDMPSFIGGLERDPESTIAGLEGLRPTLEAVAKEGKTSHRRIVEGRDTAKDLGAAPAGKAEGATGKLKDGTKVIVKNGRLVAQ